MKKYINSQKFNDGIRILGQVPIDDRLVFTSVEDLYISDATKSTSPLYSVAYSGMQVAIIGTGNEASIMVLNDATFYTPGKVQTINAQNFNTYWTVIGKTTKDYITSVIDSSLNAVHSYINATNISDNGAVDVTTTKNANGVGNTYKLKVKTDDDTIKLIEDKVTGTKYKFVAANTATVGYLKTYKLQSLAPGSTSWVDVDGSVIDIPKDNLLKNVHICKVKTSTVGGKIVYTETSKSTDARFAADTNSVYLHFEWETADQTGEAKTTESYLKVSDIIDTDLTGIRSDIDRIDSSIHRIDASIDRIDESLDASVRRIDASISEAVSRIDASINLMNDTIDASINRLDSSLNIITDKVLSAEVYYNPGNRADTVRTYSKHGNLPAGTTVAQLKAMKLSDILSAILFETVVPVKSVSMSGSISFNGYNTVQEVGSAIPTVDKFKSVFQPEVWKSTSSSGELVDTFTLSEKGNTIYYYNSANNVTGGTNITTATYTSMNEGKVLENKYYYYGQINYNEKDDAVDTNGNVIQQKKEGAYKTQTISFEGQWQIYTNASKSSKTDLWSSRNTNPGDYAGLDASVATNCLVPSNTTLYLQWPNNTTDEQKFYVYVPDSVKISKSGKANDSIANEYDSIPLQVTNLGVVKHTNENGIEGDFKKYEIAKTGGITTGKFVFTADK